MLLEIFLVVFGGLARSLGITERTVRAHTSSIVRKLNLKSRFEAAIVYQIRPRESKRSVCG